MRSLEKKPAAWGIILAIILTITASNPAKPKLAERAAMLSEDKLFDFISWTLDAAWLKLQQNALGMPHYLTHEQRKLVVSEYIRLTRQLEKLEAELNRLYADPNITDKEAASAELRKTLEETSKQQNALGPYAESILQEQVSAVAAEMGLTLWGQTIPPTLYHISPLPLNMVISPRDTIMQEGSVSLQPGLTADEQDALEKRADQALDVSTLIVPVGGIGAYPTMIMRTSDLRWLTEVIAHEWIHNYLTLRPLGLGYDASPELRTMNETTASIAGNEMGQLVMERYYPELLARESTTPGLVSLENDRPDPNDLRKPFDFRSEMHKTRVTVDQLLAEGKIEEAEVYMEQRRQYFWDNGYAIRKLNQAYFAFYGAYADVPGGAAGEDPVGPAVRALRQQSKSLAEFINRISWMTSFEQLQQAVNK